MSRTRFAELVGQAGGSESSANNVVYESGRNKPPKEEKTLDIWADVLDLHDEERELFFVLAWLERAPKEVKALVWDKNIDVRKLKKVRWLEKVLTDTSKKKK